MIQLSNIKKVFGNNDNEVVALSNINLSISNRDFGIVMGQSGSGKSTLLNILGLLDDNSDGKYLLEGIEVDKLSSKAKAWIRAEKMGFIFQSFNLIPELTVYENINLPLIYRGIGRSSRRIKVLESLDLVGISDKRKKYPNQLSGGEQQRVAIARAIAGDPVVLFADEPTGNLDSKTGETIMELLVTLNKLNHTTIVMVTHNSDHIRYGNKLITIKDGKVFENEKICEDKGRII